MRAMLLTGFGGPERLRYDEHVPDPVPADGEVLIEVGAAGLNNTDIWTREGAYGSTDDPDASSGWRREPFGFPRIQGGDVAGEIVAVGPGVDASRIGERVLVDPVLYTGDERAMVDHELLGSERDGGFAELVTVPAGNAHRIDGAHFAGTALSDAELATFPIAYLTAYRMLKRAGLRPGETVLITGASGGVGSALVQLALALDARPIAIAGKAKLDRLRQLGAEHVLARGEADPAEAVLELTDGVGVDVVADVVAGPVFGRLLAGLRPLGRYVTAGGIAGPVVETDLRTVYLRQLTLIGSTTGTHEEFAELLVLLEQGRLRPLLAGRYPLHELATAQRAFVAKDFFGKLVVEPRR